MNFPQKSIASTTVAQTVMIAAFVFVIGAVVMAISRFLWWPYTVLVAGRFVIGLGVGLASMAVPLYISEMAPPELRGQSRPVAASPLLQSVELGSMVASI